MKCRFAGLVLAVAVFGSTAANAAEIELWTARAIATVLAETGAEFERATGHRLNIHVGLPADFEKRARSGGHFDVMVSTAGTVEKWIREGKLIAASRIDLARSGIGVEVRAGAPKPDIGSVDAFRQALLEAKSIAFLNIGSGIHIASVLERLGISEAVKRKTTRPDTDIVSELVAKGDIEIGMVVITQILTTPGVELVGPLPPELQSTVLFTGAVATDARSPGTAGQLLEFLAGATAAPVIRAQGMETMVVTAGGRQ